MCNNGSDEPQCRSGQQRIYGAARNEMITITCEVDSNPSATLFRWTFNNSVVKSKDVNFRTFEEGGKSVATYSPTNEQGYGTLLCWGRNELGPQLVPCVFHIVPAGKPEPPKNCNLKNKTQTSFHVSCLKGFDGGLPQEFTLEVFDASSIASKPGRLIVNITRRVVPEFSVGSLEPGSTYFVNIYASNNKGKSNSGVPVKVTTMRMTHQEHRRNMPAPISKTGFLSTMNPMFWLCVGIIIVASIAVLSLIIIIRIRSTTGICCCDSDNENTQNSSGRSDSTEDPVKLTGSGIHAKTVSKNFITDDIAEGDERNPDVIPLTNDLEHSNATDLGDGDPGKNWTDSDANFPQQGNKFGQDQHFQLAGIKVGC
ncbi:hypothetical protein RUM44_001074 [Polyplax serrata]|uniref:Fibronectin type-III domain-containing protein n=1 Tax=Polyplax serrata TaxID=468196 RepID=A0ABR1BA76_POLSC